MELGFMMGLITLHLHVKNMQSPEYPIKQGIVHT